MGICTLFSSHVVHATCRVVQVLGRRPPSLWIPMGKRAEKENICLRNVSILPRQTEMTPGRPRINRNLHSSAGSRTCTVLVLPIMAGILAFVILARRLILVMLTMWCRNSGWGLQQHPNVMESRFANEAAAVAAISGTRCLDSHGTRAIVQP